MSEILKESSYITINLKEIISNQTPGTTNAPTSDEGTPAAGGKTPDAAGGDKGAQVKKTKVDWSTELQKRLDANKALSAESREQDAEIKEKFWKEFYTEVFGDLADELLDNLQLRLDIQKFGFKKKNNPILGFLAQTYVKTTLIANGLITDTAYDVLRLAFIKRYVAETEMQTKNGYNLIYCKAFWQLQNKEAMLNYLELQKNILSPKASIYTPEIQNRNIRVFLTKAPAMTSTSAALNSIREVQRTLGLGKNQFTRGASQDGKEASKHTELGTVDGDDTPENNFSEISVTAGKLETSAAKAAALQYILLTTGNETAQKALGLEAFAHISAVDMANNTKLAREALKGIKLKSQETINTFVKAIVEASKK